MKTTQFNPKKDPVSEAISAMNTVLAMSHTQRLYVHCLVGSQRQIDQGIATGKLGVNVTKRLHQINHAINILVEMGRIKFDPQFAEMIECVHVMKHINVMGTFHMDSNKALEFIMKHPTPDNEPQEFKDQLEEMKQRVMRNNRMN